jgi:hypothetical protein
VTKPVRLRDKRHREFVAAQACIVCGRKPSDAHHLLIERTHFASDASPLRDNCRIGSTQRVITKKPVRGRKSSAIRPWRAASNITANFDHTVMKRLLAQARLDPTTTARALWLQPHPFRVNKLTVVASDSSGRSRPTDGVE